MAAGYSSLLAVLASTHLISLLFLCPLLLSPVFAQFQIGEVSALQEFYSQNLVRSLDPGGFWNAWNFSDENACAWVGVTCTPNFTVAEIDLSGWDILNPFRPGSLSRLSDLHHLDLSSNMFFGQLVDFDNLTRLTWLDLSQNYFNGDINSISACRHLRFLSLQLNHFSGAVDSTLNDLKDLQFLLLAHNNLSGQFPTALTELSNVVSIDLSYNSFQGSIPALSNLAKLVSLKLDNNNFTKFEKSWFSTISQSLQILSVSYNQLEDVLPANITVRDLKLVNMTGNLLSGNIPSFSHRPNNAFTVDLSHNQLTGAIPSEFFKPGDAPYSEYSVSYCDSLNFSYNLLTGNVPFGGPNMTGLKILDLSHNNLSGLFPLNVFSIQIGVLRLGNNQLSGDVADILNSTGHFIDSTWVSTSELRLENNLFTGDLSKLISADYTLDYLAYLEVVDLSNNYIQWSVSEEFPDPITATLEKLTSGFLTEFWAGGNNFSGTSLPTSCFINKSDSYRSLKVLDLSGSHLQGEIFSGAFNSTCLTTLQSLNLSNNGISGLVPESIGMIPGLEVFDVSNNQLYGQLPLSLSNTSLNDRRFFEGNSGLCGYPLSLCPQWRGIQWWVLLIIIGASVMIALGSCLVATWRWRVYHKRHQQDADLIKTLMEREAATLIPLRELKKATENFAESVQIGEGGFGTVYRGKLNNGTVVAIKRSKREGSEKDKVQFLNEVRILSQVNHRNLVKLLGCCMENKVAVLVFEYIPNGTLQEHLCGKIGVGCLTWKQRLNIAMQTADALSYLHLGVVFPIYHNDVKSANILLDNNLNAKVADFGISKLASSQATHVSMIAVQGTMGYIDPEYYISYRLTDKSDVYSFGVVLLELISAKDAIDFQRGGDKSSLVYYASPYIEAEDLQELIDPALIETYNDIARDERKSIVACSKLAMKCLDMQSKVRPSMNEVLRELQNLWVKLEDTCEPQSEYSKHNIIKDDKDFQDDHRVRLADYFSEDSSSCVVEADGSIIQMLQFSGPQGYDQQS